MSDVKNNKHCDFININQLQNAKSNFESAVKHLQKEGANVEKKAAQIFTQIDLGYKDGSVLDTNFSYKTDLNKLKKEKQSRLNKEGYLPNTKPAKIGKALGELEVPGKISVIYSTGLGVIVSAHKILLPIFLDYLTEKKI
jgi:hypothetical protein